MPSAARFCWGLPALSLSITFRLGSPWRKREERRLLITIRATWWTTAGRGPDACIDAVGLEAHGTTVDAIYDYAKMAMKLETDRPHALRQAIQACRKGGTISIPGVYGGVVDKFPLGVAFSKGLTFRMGQTNVHKYLKPLLERVTNGEIDPSFVITHRLTLEQGAEGYSTFDAQDSCIKVVLRP